MSPRADRSRQSNPLDPDHILSTLNLEATQFDSQLNPLLKKNGRLEDELARLNDELEEIKIGHEARASGIRESMADSQKSVDSIRDQEAVERTIKAFAQKIAKAISEGEKRGYSIDHDCNINQGSVGILLENALKDLQ